MSVAVIIKTVKQVHSDYLVLVRTGGFLHAYGKDSYILSYLFGYKIKQLEENFATCGFPENTLNKVMATLENKKINYMILDRKNNYETDCKENYKNLNNYQKVYEKAHNYVNLQRRITNICEELQKRINDDNFKEVLQSMEEKIYEGRKI